MVGGFVAGAIGLLLTNTTFGSPWPEDWPLEIGTQVVGVALLAIILAVLRRRSWDVFGAGTAMSASMRSGILAGTAGLLVLVLAHLTAGFLVSGWTTDDSLRLVSAAALLALVASIALVATARSRVRRPQ